MAFRCTSELFNTPSPVYAQAKCTLKLPTIVKTVDEIDDSITQRFQDLKGKKTGILLSGGMDSATLASYMPGADALIFRFEEDKYQKDELKRSEEYAEYYHLNLHYVDISWENTVLPYIDVLMNSKGAPVHSIEPKIMQAALMAKDRGVECMIVGESADILIS